MLLVKKTKTCIKYWGSRVEIPAAKKIPQDEEVPSNRYFIRDLDK
jgi:hypothetical protein